MLGLEAQNQLLATKYRLSPHSCNYCIKIAIRRGEESQQFSITYGELCEAASDGCALISSWKSAVDKHLTAESKTLHPILMPEAVTDISLKIIYRPLDRLTHGSPGRQLRYFIEISGGNSFEVSEIPRRFRNIAVIPGTNAEKYCTSRLLISDVISNMEQIRQWLNACFESHMACQMTTTFTETTSPRRLLHVGQKGTKRVFLREITLVDMRDSKWTYAALSYCWGNIKKSKDEAVQLMCSKSNLLELERDGIWLSRLPQTIIDAIRVSHELGISFLWVDRLCIVQDDAEDLRCELRKMSEIYATASIVISASRAESADQGFLQDHDSMGDACKINFDAESDQPTMLLFHSKNDIQNGIEPIDWRAWTMQEHFLAARTLRFGSKQVEWKCKTERLYDGGEDGNPRSYDRWAGEIAQLKQSGSQGNDQSAPPPISSNAAVRPWKRLAFDSTTRGVTYQSDRFHTVASMAKIYAETFKLGGDDYIVGLWRPRICHDLLWNLTQRRKFRKHIINDPRIPSWSWMSARYDVAFSSISADCDADRLRIMQFDIKLVDQQNPFGEVEYARLVVEGAVLDIIWSGSESAPESMQNFNIRWDNYKIPGPGTVLRLLQVQGSEQRIIGLILDRVQNRVHRRSGWFHTHPYSECRLEWPSEHETLELH